MKKLLGSLSLLLLAASFGGTLWFLRSKTKKESVVHETLSPRMGDIVQKTVATGSVVPRKEVLVKPQVSGLIDEIMVEPGQRVRKGDLLARIRIVPDMVSLASAENRVNRARIALEDATRELGRNRRLESEGAVSEALLQASEVAREQAVEESSAAADYLELIRQGSTGRRMETSNTLVRATLGGMVLEVPVEVGDSVIETNNFNDGTTIATIADMDELIFLGKVDESEVGKLRTGMQLQLTIGAIEDQRFEAVLEHVSPKGVPENGAVQFEIRAAVKLKDEVFVRANYSANADIVLDRRQDVLCVNESVLQFDGERVFVELETAPQQFEERTIEVGLSDGIQIEVLSGLSPEDRIKKSPGLG